MVRSFFPVLDRLSFEGVFWVSSNHDVKTIRYGECFISLAEALLGLALIDWGLGLGWRIGAADWVGDWV